MKEILIIVGVLVVIFCVGGLVLNREKNPISSDTFKIIMEGKGYLVSDSIIPLVGYEDFITKSCVVEKEGGYIAFYELASEGMAELMYSSEQLLIEVDKPKNVISLNTNMKHYSKYSLTAKGRYRYISRIDNTLIYVDVDENYKDMVKDIMKEIGY